MHINQNFLPAFIFEKGIHGREHGLKISGKVRNLLVASESRHAGNIFAFTPDRDIPFCGRSAGVGGVSLIVEHDDIFVGEGFYSTP
jgi:hypothetical protein